MKSYKQFLTEETNQEFLYHVTKTSNVKKIQKEGIKPGIIVGKSNFVKASGGRYGDGSVYAHTDFTDAVTNALKMDWQHHSEMGNSGKMSVIKFKKIGDWSTDPSEDINNKGLWVKQKSHSVINPNNIVSVVPITSQHAREIASNPLSHKLKENHENF